MVEQPVRPVRHAGEIAQHFGPVSPVPREVGFDLFAVLRQHLLQLVHDGDAVVGEAHDVWHWIGAQQVLDRRLQMLPHPSIAADAAHRRFGVGMVGDVDIVPLRLRPPRLIVRSSGTAR